MMQEKPFRGDFTQQKPIDEEDLWGETPNMSGRMDNLRAAVLLPQLAGLQDNIDRWNALYRTLAAGLDDDPSITMPARPEAERFVGSSIQFLVPKFSAEECEDFVNRCAELGVELKWFGGTKPVGYTITHRHWGYVPGEALPETDQILAKLFDMRIPLTFSVSDCEHIARIIRSVLSRMRHSQAVS